MRGGCTDRDPSFQFENTRLNLTVESNFADLAVEWRALGREYDLSVFQSYDWMETFVGSLRPEDRRDVVIVVGRNEDGRIVLLLPLNIYRRFFISIATFLGDRNSAHRSPFYAPQMGVLYDKALPRHLCHQILRHLDIDCLHLPFQRVHDQAGSRPGECRDQVNLPDIVAEAVLDRPWADYDRAHRKSKTRSTERRRLKKLQQLGVVSFIVANTDPEKQELFQWLQVQKTSWLQQKGLKSFMAFPDTVKFLCAIAGADRPDASFRGVLTALRIGNELGAVSLGVLYNNRFSGLVLAVSQDELLKYGPGRLLIGKTLEWCSDQGVKSICFGASLDGGLGKDWTDRRYALVSSATGLTIRGRFVAWIIRVFWALRAHVKRNGRLRQFYFALCKGLAPFRWPEWKPRLRVNIVENKRCTTGDRSM